MAEKSKILIVDDEEFNRDILTDCLTDGGYEVIVANDGLEALEQLKNHNDVSMVILDLMMPKMNGEEVLETIKSDARLKNIPVIIQTAAASQVQLKKLLDAGAYENLIKPYNVARLLEIVNAAHRENIGHEEVKV